MKKSRVLVLFVFIACLFTSLCSYAEGWKQYGNAWVYENADGSFITNGWHWIDGNNDGIEECYYFDGRGYCLTNTTTPDNYQVNQNGAWVVNGIVQTRRTGGVIRNDLSATTFPTNLNIDLGTSLATAVQIFNSQSIAYQSDGENLHYFDVNGWIHGYHFNSNGICDVVITGVGQQTKETSDMLVAEFQKLAVYPLRQHIKNETNTYYLYIDDSGIYSCSVYQELQLGKWYTSVSLGKVFF